MADIQNGNGHQSYRHADVVNSFVKAGNVPTHLVQLGKLGEPNGMKQRTLMLIIPGNPGVPTFYEDFMRELYDQSGGQIPVWAIGHAVHTQPPNESLSLKDIGHWLRVRIAIALDIDDEGMRAASRYKSESKEYQRKEVAPDEDIYGLEAQINQKVAFIKEHVPPDVKLILIGHSIGCYMILNSLEKIPTDSVQRCFMLFPTIERMAVSPNGASLTPIFRYLRWIVVLLAYFCFLLPEGIRCSLIKFIYRKVDYPHCMTPAILTTISPWTVNFSTYLAKLEMKLVADLQKDIVRKHSNKLSFYYGASDLWCPVQYHNEFVDEFPKIDVRLCELNMKHAFVMVREEGLQMAELIWQWLKSHEIPKSFSNGVKKRDIKFCQGE